MYVFQTVKLTINERIMDLHIITNDAKRGALTKNVNVILPYF